MSVVALLLVFVSLFSSIGGVAILYYSTLKVPLDYRVPKIVKEDKVDVRQLERKLSLLFPQKEEKEKPKTSVVKKKTNVKVPKVEIVGIAKGRIAGVMFKVRRKYYILLRGETKDGWKLVEIKDKFVILEYKGTEVRVPIKGKEFSFKPVKVDLKENTPPKVSKSTERARTITVSKDLVLKLTQNYGELLRQVDFAPYIVGGKNKGFKIRWLNPGSIFYKLGFRRGDVIVSVNGVALKNTEDLFKVLQIIRNEPSLRVIVLRNGKEETFNIRIE